MQHFLFVYLPILTSKIISKGMMDPIAKIALLSKLNLTSVFASVSMVTETLISA